MSYSQTCTTGATGPAVTVESLAKTREQFERLVAIRESTEAELGQWMRNQGFPPESSYLVLPIAMADNLPQPFWPKFVRFSHLVKDLTLVRA